jgi:hypothetical protein
MAESKRVGRPATLTKEQRQEQLRAGKAAHRARAEGSGRVRLDVTVEGQTKAVLEAYRDEHGLTNLGAALDAILFKYVDRET